MSDETAEAISNFYSAKDERKRRRDFISRMEHKLHSKERRASDRHSRS